MRSNNTKTDGMGHKIKKRTYANDVFITPRELGMMHIRTTKNYVEDQAVWYDPFRHDDKGTYYSQFPTDRKEWAEITEGRDFFTHDPGHIDVICSNPPYSMIDKVFEKSCSLKPSVISYIIGVNNMTTRRLEKMNQHGYTLVYTKMLKVYKWFGMSFICIWKTNQPPNSDIIQYDRKVWR
jgi:hypothetical protein